MVVVKYRFDILTVEIVLHQGPKIVKTQLIPPPLCLFFVATAIMSFKAGNLSQYGLISE